MGFPSGSLGTRRRTRRKNSEVFMPDLTTISAALSSLKSAIDIAKFLRESDHSLEKAELKLKFADLVSKLADTKIELVEIQDVLIEKDKRISELEEAFEIKSTLIRDRDAYYVSNVEGKPVGVPYCLRCWENDHKKRQIVCGVKDYLTKICTTCGQKYNGRMTNEIQSPNK
jgi:hypothetical protein